MINDANVETLPVVPAITALEVCQWPVALTGSRYIGGAKKTSDWDFVAAHDPHLESYLVAAGFQESPRFNKAPNKNDGYTVAVYEQTSRGVKVQVQFTSNLMAKLVARNTIRHVPVLTNMHLAASTTARIGMWKILCTSAVTEGTMFLYDDNSNLVLGTITNLDWSAMHTVTGPAVNYSVA